MIQRRRAGVLAAVTLVSVTVLSACSSSGSPPVQHPTASQGPSASQQESPPGTATAHVGDLEITGGYIPKPASPDVAAAYFTVTNSGSRTDSLVKVTTNVTKSVQAMTESVKDGVGSMTDLPHVSIPPHGSFRFTRGHAHLMLQKPTRELHQGDKVSMTITFADAGTVELTLPVVPIAGPGTS